MIVSVIEQKKPRGSPFYPEGEIFLPATHTYDGLFFLLIIQVRVFILK